MTDTRIIWAAGFIDGEGCFYSRKNNVRSYTARVTASQNVREPLDILQTLFGGRVEWVAMASMKKRGGIWRWTIEKRAEVIPCCEQLAPWLIVKRQQAELLLEIAKLVNAKKGRDPAGFDRNAVFARQTQLSEQLLGARNS